MSTSEGLPISDEEIELLRELVRNNVPFMIVGMGAAVILGADFITQDLDIWFKTTSHPGVSAAAQKAGGVFIWRISPQKFSGQGLENIDVVFHCHGLLSFDDEYENAITVPFLPDLDLKVLPIERILASKIAANRPKDRAVIPALKAAVAAIKSTKRR